MLSEKDIKDYPNQEELIAEIEKLKIKLKKAEKTLDTLRNSGVDTLIVDSSTGKQFLALEKTDHLYRALIDDMNDGVAILTSNYVIFYCNSQFTSILKIPFEKVMGKSISDFISFDKIKKYKKILNQKHDIREEILIKANNGTKIPILITIRYLDDINAIYLIIKDLSGQKKAVESLKESESTLRSFFHSTGDMMGIVDIVADNDVRHITNNVLTANYFGMTPKMMHDKLGSELGEPEEVLRKWIKHFKESESTGKPISFEYLDNKENKEAWLVAKVNYIGKNSQGQSRFGYIVRDITERKKAEDTLQESKEQFRSIFDSSLDALYRRNLITGRYDYFSPVIEQITGFSVREVLDMGPEGILKHVHPDDLSKVMSEKMELSSEVTQGKLDYMFLCKDNTYKWVSDRFKIIYNEEGEPIIREGTVRDITDRKKTEEELTKSEEKYRLLHESMRDAFISVTMDGKINEFNDTFKDMLGYSEKELYNLTYVDLTPEKWHAMEKKIVYSQILPRGFSDVYKKEYIRKDGTVFPVELKTFLIRDKNGEPLFMWAIIRDITERKKAEEELMESKDLFSAVFENAAFGIAIGDMEGHVLESNYALEDMLGYSKDEFRGMSFSEFTHPEDVMKEWSLIEDLLAGKTDHYEIEKRYIRKDGTNIFVRLIGSFIAGLDGKPLNGIALIEDVTEHKKAEEAIYDAKLLAENRQKYLETIFENAPTGIVIIEAPDGHISYVNPEGLRLYGRKPGNLLSIEEHSRQLKLLKPDGELFPPQELPASRALLHGENINNIEILIEHPDSTRISVLASTNPIYDENNKIVSAVGIFRDITEHKKLEEKLRKSHDNLELKVEDRTAELDILIDELKHSNQELQQFAHVASHDLQEPLRTIASFTQLLERRYKGQLDSDADEFIEYIVSAAKRMQTLINDLLQYSRVTTKGKEFQPADVNEVMDTVLKNLKSSIDENNAEITVDKLPTVMADDSQLIQLFQNLTGNAIKFKKADEPPKIHISAQKNEEKNEYLFSVSDNGIGMESQYAERIFVIFQRLHTIDEYKGTGIGLSISKKIVKRHGGHIWVESKFGLGSIFYFTIPITDVSFN